MLAVKELESLLWPKRKMIAEYKVMSPTEILKGLLESKTASDW